MKVFETKTELSQATLTENQLVMIKGSSTPNDGQTNFYYIRTPAQFGGTPDGVNDIPLANGNIAELMTGQTRFQNDQFQIWNGTSYEGVRKQRNYITDGRFDFWYEGTNQTSSGYGSDTMWLNSNVGSTKTHTQETLTAGVDLPAVDNPTAEFFSRTVVSSVAGADNFVRKLQRVESVKTLAGKKANLNLYAKADSTKNIAVELVQFFGSGGSPSATVTGIGTNKFEITANWAFYDFTIDIPSIAGKTLGTNNDDHLRVVIYFDAGSNFNSRTDSLGQQSGTFDIACVQLEEGESATKFEELSKRQNLSEVSRYFQRIGTESTSGNYWNSYAEWLPNNRVLGFLTLPVEMRTIPNGNFNTAITSLSTTATPAINEISLFNANTGGFVTGTLSSATISGENRRVATNSVVLTGAGNVSVGDNLLAIVNTNNFCAIDARL